VAMQKPDEARIRPDAPGRADTSSGEPSTTHTDHPDGGVGVRDIERDSTTSFNRPRPGREGEGTVPYLCEWGSRM
jgi:hypothetical protein